MEIDLFLFTSKDWNLLTSHSKHGDITDFALTSDQIRELKQDQYLLTFLVACGKKPTAEIESP